MNEEPKRLWLEALRSGEYEQARNALQNHLGFCCLGVACEVAVREGIIPPPVWVNGEAQYEGASGLLPESAQEWLGVPDTSPSVFASIERDLEESTELTSLNDTWGWTFEKIADAIEASL